MQENSKLAWQDILSCKKEERDNISSLNNSIIIKDIIKRSNELKDQVIVLKLPSVIINDNNLLTSFAETIQLLEMCGAKICIVHDHIDLENSQLLALANTNLIDKIVKLGKSNPAIIEIFSNYINKLIVTKLGNVGCYAIGISGKDANLIQAKKSKLPHRRATDHDIIDIGFINEPIIVNPEILLNFEDSNIIPVISPVANDEQENTHLLDSNLTASAISSALSADHLVLPYNACKTFTPNIKTHDINLLKTMLSNNDNYIGQELIKIAISAIENNSSCIHFINSQVPSSLLLTMFANYMESR